MATRTRTGVVAWDGFEPSYGLLQRQVGYRLPDQAKQSARKDSNLRHARFQTAYADLTALLAVEGGVGHRNGLHGDAQARRLVLGIETR